jgi:hypothetical protein
MLTKRLIACLDVRDGKLAKSVKFVNTRDIGDPVAKARDYYADGVDELVLYDITASSDRRDIMLDVVERVAEQVFIPFSVDGGIRSVDDATKLRLRTDAIPNMEKHCMEKRTLGRTGLEVSVVGFGAMTIGGIYGPIDDAVSTKALHTAIDAGMNFIDTSDAYGAGHSEEIIGAILKTRPDRDQIVVCTKGGNNMVTGQRNFTPDYIRGCVEGSLRRLGVDAIDVYLRHNPAVENLQAEDSFEVLETYKTQGKIKHWGVSVNTLPECELAVACGRPAVRR